MFLTNFQTACGIWCALVLCASGQNAAPTREERIDAAEARLRELAQNNDIGGPRRPMSPEMRAVDRNLLDHLGADDLAKMSLDDPLLKWACADVFLRCMGRFEQLNPQQKLVLADMRRRGEAVSPMLLKLISENQENIIEFSILGKIGYLDTVRIEPFLEYARKLLRERTKTMTDGSAGAASYTLSRYGSREDEALLEWVIKERSYVASGLTKDLKTMRARLDPQPESGAGRQDVPSSDPGTDARPGSGTGDHP